MNTDDTLHALHEQRLTTLALADQIKEDRWREPLLPGDRSLHDLLAHILGWDEWAVGVFEISRLRALPPVLIDALRDVDGYNARAMRRYANITRDDLMSALQASPDRVLASAIGPGGENWQERRFPELAHVRTLDAQKDESVVTSRGPSVGGLLRVLLRHETSHHQEISAAFGISPDLDRFRDDESVSTPE
ncbi:MAG TPA: maleylpyruvate isomerase N-terminal domain-containing protein [Ktedonobacterales bacterium]|nr:maleylpyruvate isomerase N-terminal domain-containing protein [Ktedonobacterales bacterium]